jgi:hypothetical protein
MTITMIDGLAEELPVFVCLRDEASGAFTTNFYQTVSLEPSVYFHTPGRREDVLRAIALNILAMVFPGEEIELSMGHCSTVAVSLHRLFVDEVLSTMPGEGGNLPRSVVREWALEVCANHWLEDSRISA